MCLTERKDSKKKCKITKLDYICLLLQLQLYLQLPFYGYILQFV